MRKVIFIASVLKKHINVFHIPYIRWFKENGYRVDVLARNDYKREPYVINSIDNYYNIKIDRFPLTLNNFFSYFKIKKILNKNNYDLIHCHTPIGGLLTRLAVKKSSNSIVIYTAHGFHFYKGSNFLTWLIYFPIEKLLSKKTNCLITINNEDYTIAKTFKSTSVHKVNGVGFNIDINKPISTINRSELGIKKTDFMIVSVGELSNRKNHIMVLKALKILNNENIHYFICGDGPLKSKLLNYSINNNLNVHFLGFRNDIPSILSLADIFIFPSKQEGLPISLLEAIYVGIPSIATNIRGSSDIIINGKNGYLFENIDELVKLIKEVYENKLSLDYNLKERSSSVEKYSIESVIEEMKIIYKKYL
jgi:glycosyltransferase EpsD